MYEDFLTAIVFLFFFSVDYKGLLRSFRESKTNHRASTIRALLVFFTLRFFSSLFCCLFSSICFPSFENHTQPSSATINPRQISSQTNVKILSFKSPRKERKDFRNSALNREAVKAERVNKRTRRTPYYTLERSILGIYKVPGTKFT